MKKNLKYYINLKYKIKITKIPDDEGGGYNACIPLLGSYALQGDGETKKEAIENLEK